MDVGSVSLERLFEDVAQLLLREPGAPSGPDGFSEGAVHCFAAVGAHLLFGDLRDNRSHALPGSDEALALEVLVCPARRDDAAREVVGQGSNGGKLRSRRELAAEDKVAELRLDLPV